ncbi:MAG: GTPase Era [Burkholderiaceae bacterium]
MTEPVFRCGYVAVVGRPNVGKSTLLNRLVGQKLAITSDRPQTTRHRITGIVNRPGAQLLVLDTPGVQDREVNAMNRVLNRTAQQVAEQADVLVLVADARGWREEDDRLARKLPIARIPTLLALNKIDRLTDRAPLFEMAQALQTRYAFAEIVPISAQTGLQVDLLADLCAARLPEGPARHEPDELTDRSEKFLAAELIREKLFRRLGAELPYASTVLIDKFEEAGNLRRIAATILVARDSQKAIVLGAGGQRIKQIATEARLDLEKLLDSRVFLEVFVKVRSGWADNEQSLRAYGYE